MTAVRDRRIKSAIHNSSASAAFGARLVAVQPTPLVEPAPEPASPGRQKRREQPLPVLSDKLHKRRNVQLAIFVRSITVISGLVGVSAVFLGGYIQLNQEKVRSKVVSNNLFQQQQQYYYWDHRRALLVTPEKVGEKAVSAGMVRPEDKDTIDLK